MGARCRQVQRPARAPALAATIRPGREPAAQPSPVHLYIETFWAALRIPQTGSRRGQPHRRPRRSGCDKNRGLPRPAALFSGACSSLTFRLSRSPCINKASARSRERPGLAARVRAEGARAETASALARCSAPALLLLLSSAGFTLVHERAEDDGRANEPAALDRKSPPVKDRKPSPNLASTERVLSSLGYGKPFPIT